MLQRTASVSFSAELARTSVVIIWSCFASAKNNDTPRVTKIIAIYLEQQQLQVANDKYQRQGYSSISCTYKQLCRTYIVD